MGMSFKDYLMEQKQTFFESKYSLDEEKDSHVGESNEQTTDDISQENDSELDK